MKSPVETISMVHWSVIKEKNYIFVQASYSSCTVYLTPPNLRAQRKIPPHHPILPPPGSFQSAFHLFQDWQSSIFSSAILYLDSFHAFSPHIKSLINNSLFSLFTFLNVNERLQL